MISRRYLDVHVRGLRRCLPGVAADGVLFHRLRRLL